MRCVVEVLLVALVAATVHAGQAVDATVCQVLARPSAFDGKTVRLRGVVVLEMENFSIVARCQGENELGAIWLEYGYPEEAPTPYCCPGGFDSHGTPIFSEPRVTLRRDRSFEKLKRDLDARRAGKDAYGDDCRRSRLAPRECQRFIVTATLTGRLSGLDHVEGMNGFGHFGMFSARLSIERVEKVSAAEGERLESGVR